MTVKELIEKLKELPEDMGVFTLGEEVEGNKLDCVVYKPYFRVKRVVEKDGKKYKVQRPCKENGESIKALLL